MKTLRIKSINGDISFQDVTLQIYPYDFVPIVNLDLEQLSPNPQNKRVYDGFEIKKPASQILSLGRLLFFRK